MKSKQDQQTTAEEVIITQINLVISEIQRLGIQFDPSEAYKETIRRLESVRSYWEETICPPS